MKELLRRVSTVVRRVIGAPDYEAYVAHVSSHHPDMVPLRREQFVHERLVARYSRPGARCC